MNRCLAILLILLVPAWTPANPCWGQQAPARSVPIVREGPQSTAGTSTSVDQRCIAASVRIDHQTRGGRANLGSGTCIAVDRERSRALVITCKHLFPSGKAEGVIGVTFPAAKRHYANLVAVDTAADLAALEIASPEGIEPFIPVAATDARPGETIWLAGYPGGQGPKPRTGRVIGYRGYTATARVLNLSVWSDHGDSGCGVFRPDNTLVGVLWGGDDRNKNDTSVTGLPEINRFLQAKCFHWFNRNRQPSQPPVAVTPPLQPSAPVVQPPPEPGLSAQIAALQKDIDELKKRPLPTPPVQPGPPGPPGKDVDVAAIQKQIGDLQIAINALATPKVGPPKPPVPSVPPAPAPVRIRVVPASQ